MQRAGAQVPSPMCCLKLVGAVLAQEEEVGQGGLDEEDGGDAGDGQPDEGVFGDASLPSDGLPFVDAVDEEGQDVDADEVDDKGTHWANFVEEFLFIDEISFVLQEKPVADGVYLIPIVK